MYDVNVNEDWNLLNVLDPEEKLRRRGALMKQAKDKAVVMAFEKVLLMVLGRYLLYIHFTVYCYLFYMWIA